jgi:hypothetical protein
MSFFPSVTRNAARITSTNHDRDAPSAVEPCLESDILGPSEAFRRELDYYSHTKDGRAMIERLAAAGPTTLACMHGSAWRGDAAALLRALGDSLSQ